MKSCLPPDPHPVQARAASAAGRVRRALPRVRPAEVFPYAPDRSYTPPDAPFERLVALHDFLARRGVIVQASCHGTDNTAMLDAIARGNGRYRGVAIVDGDVTDEQLADLNARGVRGVRFNFVAHLGGAPDLDVFAACSNASGSSAGTSCCIRHRTSCNTRSGSHASRYHS